MQGWVALALRRLWSGRGRAHNATMAAIINVLFILLTPRLSFRAVESFPYGQCDQDKRMLPSGLGVLF